MGATKYEIYPPEIVEVTEIVKAIAHPARMQAVLIVAGNTDGDVTVKDLQKEIKLAQSTLSQHLKVLVEAGVLKTRLSTRTGNSLLIYRVERSALIVITRVLENILKKVNLKSDRKYDLMQAYYSKFRMFTNWQDRFIT